MNYEQEERRIVLEDTVRVIFWVALLLAGAYIFAGCSGQSGADRTCNVTGQPSQLTDRIAIAQCGDGTLCIGACGGTQDSNNPDNSTNDSNNPDNSDRRVITNVNPTPTPGRIIGG